MEIGEAGNENELNRGRSNKEYNCMAQCHGLVEYISSRQPDRENAMKCRKVKHYIDKNKYNKMLIKPIAMTWKMPSIAIDVSSDGECNELA